MLTRGNILSVLRGLQDNIHSWPCRITRKCTDTTCASKWSLWRLALSFTHLLTNYSVSFWNWRIDESMHMSREQRSVLQNLNVASAAALALTGLNYSEYHTLVKGLRRILVRFITVSTLRSFSSWMLLVRVLSDGKKICYWLSANTMLRVFAVVRSHWTTPGNRKSSTKDGQCSCSSRWCKWRYVFGQNYAYRTQATLIQTGHFTSKTVLIIMNYRVCRSLSQLSACLDRQCLH